MNKSTPDQPTGMNELREIYFNCDVSNNGTENPLSFLEFVAALQQIVERCIGPDEKSKHVRRFQCPKYGLDCYEWTEQWKMNSDPPYCSVHGKKMKSVEFDEQDGDDWTRNELRAEFRHNLQQAGLLRGDVNESGHSVDSTGADVNERGDEV